MYPYERGMLLNSRISAHISRRISTGRSQSEGSLGEEGIAAGIGVWGVRGVLGETIVGGVSKAEVVM